LHSHQIPPHLTFARPRAKLKFTFLIKNTKVATPSTKNNQTLQNS